MYINNDDEEIAFKLQKGKSEADESLVLNLTKMYNETPW